MPSLQSGHAWEYFRFADLFGAQVGGRLPGRTLAAEQRQRTLKQAVVVGIGGAGTEIAARLKLSRDRFYGELGEWREMIQIVAFDTQDFNMQSELVQETLRLNEEYVHLGNFNGHDLTNANRNNPDLQRWWEPKYPVGAVPIRSGCNRIRQLGRLCLWRWRNRVTTALTNAINRARTLDNRAVSQLLLPQLGDGDAIRFYVISGSCGGTGSGMFLDLCYLLYRAARAQGILTPNVRCLIVMPTLHVEQVRAKQPMLVDAFQANAYAFFKELQHFTHHGTEFFEHCFNAHELLEAGADRLEDWRPGNRIYLIDNTVGGLVLRDLPDLFTLAADALFHLLITPLGVNEDGQGANLIDNLVVQEHQGRITGFSSAGVSYVLLPARTVTRCALAGYLRDVVYQRLTRDVTDDDREAAKKQAETLFKQHRSRLDPALVTDALLKSHLMTLQSVAPSRRWIDEKERALRGNWESIRDEGDKLLDGWQAQAVTAMTETYNQQHAAWLADVETLTVDQVNDCGGSDCIYFAQQVLRELRRKVADAEVPHSTLNKNRASASATAAKNEVTARARKFFRSAGRIKNALSDYFTFKRQLVEHTAREEAVRLGEEYRGHVLRLFDDAIARCDAVYKQLRDIGNALDDQADDYDPKSDERLLTSTTQIVPPGGVEGAVKRALSGLNAHLESDARDLLRTPEAPLWALGSADEDSRRRATEELLKDLLNVGFERVRPLLSQRVDEAARSGLEDEAREAGESDPAKAAQERWKTILSNMNQLAQPAWQLNLDRWGLDGSELPFVESVAKPDAMPDDPLPQPLQGNSKPLDDRNIMLLRTRHGAPLHAMIPFETFRDSYRSWVKDKSKAHREPLHLCKDWNEGKGMLEDIFPIEGTMSPESVRYFALGMFSDWLVREQKVAAASGLVELNKEHGFVFRKGPNQYVAVLIEQTPKNTLRKRDTKTLCPAAPKNRMEACKNFDHECVASGKLFMERLENVMAWEELEHHINSYITSLRQQIQDGKLPREQGEAEIKALGEYLEQG